MRIRYLVPFLLLPCTAIAGTCFDDGGHWSCPAEHLQGWDNGDGTATLHDEHGHHTYQADLSDGNIQGFHGHPYFAQPAQAPRPAITNSYPNPYDDDPAPAQRIDLQALRSTFDNLHPTQGQFRGGSSVSTPNQVYDEPAVAPAPRLSTAPVQNVFDQFDSLPPPGYTIVAAPAQPTVIEFHEPLPSREDRSVCRDGYFYDSGYDRCCKNGQCVKPKY